MWSLLNNNPYCAEKEQLKVNQIHFEKLLGLKARIDNKPNEVPFFLKNKSYLRELIRTRNNKIKAINKLMNIKLKTVAKSPSLYSKENNIPKYCPAFDRQKFNFARIERERKINSENITFYKRFKKKKPTYSTKNFLKKADYQDIIRDNISRGRNLQQYSLKFCTFREFKSHFIKESSKIRGKHKLLNKTNSSNNFYKPNSLETPNGFNNKHNFSSDNYKSLSDRNISNKISKPKLNNIRNEIKSTRLINSKKIYFKF